MQKPLTTGVVICSVSIAKDAALFFLLLIIQSNASFIKRWKLTSFFSPFDYSFAVRCFDAAIFYFRIAIPSWVENMAKVRDEMFYTLMPCVVRVGADVGR